MINMIYMIFKLTTTLMIARFPFSNCHIFKLSHFQINYCPAKNTALLNNNFPLSQKLLNMGLSGR
jgi:hypothetical protein